ncbi:hypothetical protein [Candidatus Uabimicrobium amorphum]|uniref:hypothetical protein n=1 Tax=Uabimicrobium amorphum TaxID=2596890 RepID=UPI0034A5B017
MQHFFSTIVVIDFNIYIMPRESSTTNIVATINVQPTRSKRNTIPWKSRVEFNNSPS